MISQRCPIYLLCACCQFIPPPENVAVVLICIYTNACVHGSIITDHGIIYVTSYWPCITYIVLLHVTTQLPGHCIAVVARVMVTVRSHHKMVGELDKVVVKQLHCFLYNMAQQYQTNCYTIAIHM